MKIKAFLLATTAQAFFVLIFFVGSLLDPLIGLCVAGFYFLVIGYFLTYHFILNMLPSRNPIINHQ